MTIPAATDQDKAVRKHIRGSSILLGGRFIAIILNFLVQVITVRYLTKSDYGAFAYALSISSIGTSLALWSMDKALLRFLPIYDEQGDENAQRGTLLLTLATISGISLALIVLLFGLQGLIAERLVSDPVTVTLLLITIFLTPTGALDNWFQSIFAVFSSAKAIFFRRHILGPSLKLLAVVVVMLLQADVYMLAWGYVLGGVIGILTYGTVFGRVMSKKRLFQDWNWRNLRLPIRAIYTYSTPLMFSDLVFVLRNNLVLVLIEAFHDTTSVAAFRAVVPVARLNEIVFQSFTFLYTPLAARLYARKEGENINALYWRTALWIIVFSFPIFVVTFSLAEPVTVLLFGERYASSAPILAIFSFGYYFNAALGFNSHTVRVYGVVRFLIIIDFAAAFAAIVLSFVLIPPYGALGAAVSAAGALIIHNLLNHLGLVLHTDVRLFDWRYLKAYVMVAAASLGLLAFHHLLETPIYVDLPIAVLLSLLILILNRSQLNIPETFPELLKIKPLRKLFGA